MRKKRSRRNKLESGPSHPDRARRDMPPHSGHSGRRSLPCGMSSSASGMRHNGSRMRFCLL
ncbi:hypothetical protein OROGR_020951 [Orobanche gracilis]